MSKCWLCEFNQEAEAIRMSQFMSDNAAYMGIAQMARAIHNRLQELDPDGAGHSIPDIEEHIKSHVLIPNVKVSVILRSLILLLDKLEGGLLTTGDDDITIIDAKNVGIYLKLVSEIMQIYKTGECNRLMFSDNCGTSGMENSLSKKRKGI